MRQLLKMNVGVLRCVSLSGVIKIQKVALHFLCGMVAVGVCLNALCYIYLKMHFFENAILYRAWWRQWCGLGLSPLGMPLCPTP